MKKFKHLNVGHVNVYFIHNKLHDVSLLMEKQNIDVFGLSETKLTDIHSDIILDIPNFSYFRKNKETVGDTGILVYYKNYLAPYITRRTDLEQFGVECIWIELKLPHNVPLLICNTYRNGTSDNTWFFKFADMLDKIKITNHELILLGDFNINLLEPHSFWDSTLSLYQLTQLIKTPTRKTHSSSTLIDHIYTNVKDKIINVLVSASGISDHYPIFCTYLLKTPKPNNNTHVTIESRSFKNFKEEDFLIDLSLCNFTQIYKENDPNRALKLFYDIFIPLLDKHAPIIKRRIKHRIKPGWLTDEIITEMDIRDKLSKDKSTPEYKKQRNKVTTLVRKAKKTYFNKLIESNETIATLWRVTNQIIGKNSNNGRANTVTRFTAEECNDYFTNLASKLVQSKYGSTADCTVSPMLESFCENKDNTNFEIPLLSEQDTFRYIKNLKNKKSCGTDTINVFFLKLALPFINTPLTHIYNTSISSGIFPEILKKAKVIPIPKCKNAKDLNDYRPISLLNILSKPLEKHIHRHIYSHLETNQLFHPFQSGFRQKHSCHTASVRIIDTWLNNINKDTLNGAVFLDLRKAFDLVDHNILIEKLSLYLKNNKIISLLKSYLSSRTQTVVLNNIKSSERTIPCGVPQG